MLVEVLSEDQKMVLEALKETKEINQLCGDELKMTHAHIDYKYIFRELMIAKRARAGLGK